MELVLEVESTEKHLMGQNARHVFLPAGGVIGRSPDCDWVIPDQTRHMSGRHAIVSFESGQFYITDISTNGIYLNQTEVLAKNRATPLQDGDRLLMGQIQFQVRINMDASQYVGGAPALSAAGMPPVLNPGGKSPVAPHAGAANPMEQVAKWAAEQAQAKAQPGAEGWHLQSNSMPDNVAPEHIPFELPKVKQGLPPPSPTDSAADSGASLPDNWWEEPLEPAGSTPPRPVVKPVAEAAAGPFVTPVMQPAVKQAASADPAEEFSLPSQPASRPASQSVRQSASQSVRQATAQTAAQETAIAPLLDTPGDNLDAALQAFADGLGVNPTELLEAGGLEFLQRAGKLLRTALYGLVTSSRARALMKNEFRLDMTLVNAKDNNPLKLSANGEQAIKHMLREEAGTFMPMERAMQECFEDVREHQLAMLAGMQGALLDLMDTLSPEELEKRFEKGRSGISIGSRNARLWEAYCELHKELLGEDHIFSSLFAEPFARAYDEQMVKLKKSRTPRGTKKE